MKEENKQHTHSSHGHHHHDEIHDFRKHGINRIYRRKLFVKVAYWTLFTLAILCVLMVIIVYKFL